MDKNMASGVLIADGDKDACLQLEKSLSEWGYDVVVASDGNEAWKKLKEQDAPKLVILNWIMGGMSGLEVCRKMREIKTLTPAHVILLTSREEKKSVVDGLEAGANDCVSKPFDNDELRARLDVGSRSVALQDALVNSAKQQGEGDFQGKEQMEQTIEALKNRISELEKGLSAGDAGVEPASVDTLPETSADILNEIVFVFKRGEINLPSPPQIGIKFKEMINKGANLGQIATILKQDAAVSSKLISISNSAFYRGIAENQTLDQAVGRLGLSTTKQYVDAIANRSLYFTKNKNLKDLIEKLWEHSLSCAYASQIVSQILKVKLAEDTFTLGLLHDIGRLVLLQAVGELQIKQKIGEKIDNDELTDTIDKNHGKFGSALLKKWKFSDEFALVANYHDNLEGCSAISTGLLIVAFANLLVKSMGYSMVADGEIDLEDAKPTRLLKLDTGAISTVKDRVNTQMEDLKDFFR